MYGWPDGSQLGRSRPDKKSRVKVACAQLCDTITIPQLIPKRGRFVWKQKDTNTFEIICENDINLTGIDPRQTQAEIGVTLRTKMKIRV